MSDSSSVVAMASSTKALDSDVKQADVVRHCLEESHESVGNKPADPPSLKSLPTSVDDAVGVDPLWESGNAGEDERQTTTATCGTSHNPKTPSLDPDESKQDQVSSLSSPPAPLSKKALKRQRRWDMKLEVKKRRKEHQRESKRAKAILDGRDVEKERREIEERTKEGEGRKRREKLILDRITSSADKSFQVCLDCSFEEHMTEKEINSLSSQIRYCYASNKRAPNPVYLSVTSLSGKTRAILDKVDGFPEGWVGRGFAHHVQSVEEVHDKSKLVYLTSDSPNILNDLDNEKVYIIGGIVDRNRLKRATINRAEQLGIVTAKLPITQHLQLFSTKVLTCNHVFDILLKYHDCGKDWKKAMLEVLPERKDAQEK